MLMFQLGKMDRKKIAALVGVAPMNFDSGKKRGYRKTKGGRADVRSVLYMSTLVAATALMFVPTSNNFFRVQSDD